MFRQCETGVPGTRRIALREMIAVNDADPHQDSFKAHDLETGRDRKIPEAGKDRRPKRSDCLPAKLADFRRTLANAVKNELKGPHKDRRGSPMFG